MVGLFPTLAVIFFSLAIVLWALSLFVQGYLYSEPAEQLYWRAPLAGLILTAFLGFWCFLDFRSPGHYGAIQDVSASEHEQFDHFWSVKNKQETAFRLKKTPQGRFEYRDASGKAWSRSDTEGVVQALIVEDKDHEKIRFEAEMTPDGKFKTLQGGTVRYVEAGGQGRVMTDDYPGKLSTTRWSRVLGNLFLNFLHLGVWFAGLWLLLRFQWSHALGLAVVLWLGFTFILPTLFKKTEDLAKQQAVPAESSTLEPAPRLTLMFLSRQGILPGGKA